MPVPTTNDISGRVNDTVYPPPPTPEAQCFDNNGNQKFRC
jgi:hypothetical protein